MIKINCETADRPTVMGRELHEVLGIKTQYSKWFDRMCEYGFTENSDFIAVSQKRLTAQNNETTFIDHQMTIDMAKEICMIQRTEIGRKCRQYFLEVEKQWQSPEAIMKRALTLADERIKLLEQERLNAPISTEQSKKLYKETEIKAIDLCGSGRVYSEFGENIQYRIRQVIYSTIGVNSIGEVPVGRYDEAVELCRSFKPDATTRGIINRYRSTWRVDRKSKSAENIAKK